MTTAVEILEELHQREVKLFVSEGRLRYRCPPGVMTPELSRAITKRKREIPKIIGNVPAWDRETLRLIRWFHRADFPENPDTAGLICWARAAIAR